MNQDVVIVNCSSCGAKNRIPKARLKERPLCGKCKTSLQPETVILQCSQCGAKNRVIKALIHDHPKCGKCHSPLATIPFYSHPVTLTEQTFDQEILQFPGPSLVDFYSTSCGYCTLLDPILDQLASEYAGRLKIGKINIEHSPMTASRFEVMSTPTVIFFKNGHQVDKLLGAVPKEEIEGRLRNVLG